MRHLGVAWRAPTGARRIVLIEGNHHVARLRITLDRVHAATGREKPPTETLDHLGERVRIRAVALRVRHGDARDPVWPLRPA